MGLLLGRGDPCDLVVIDQSCPADARKAADDKLRRRSARNHGRIVREKVAQLYGFDLD
jgi:hypothetical protein